jgi:hypothetical protein
MSGTIPPALHLRTQIRRYVAAKVTAAVPVGVRVHNSRRLPSDAREAPSVNIISAKDSMQQILGVGATIGGALMERQYLFALTLTVPFLAAAASGDGSDGVDDALDALSLLVEEAILSDLTLGGISRETVLVETQFAPPKAGASSFEQATLFFRAKLNVDTRRAARPR